jgi:fido (protein-threonine AMPylation protein)
MIFGPPIDGETPIDDRSGLLDKGIVTRQQLNAVEAANILRAAETYFLGPPALKASQFDYTFGRKLHRQMFCDVWSWAGELRRVNPNIGVPWQQIETRLYELFASIPYWAEQPWSVQAAWLHHKAVFIHPFRKISGSA